MIASPALLAALLTLAPAHVPPSGTVPPVEPLGPPLSAKLAQVKVNTVWVIPELRRAWVEPLTAIRKPGGGLYQLNGNIVQRDIAVSVRDAVAFLKTHPDVAPGFADGYRSHDLYFAWDDEEQPRAGPSAGLAFVVAAYAAMLDVPVLSDVALTGAVDDSGKVRAVAGLALKLEACRQAGMRTLCLPAADKIDPRDIELSVASELRIVAVSRADEAFFEAFGLNGPQKSRYDRLLNLYDDYRKANAARQWVSARLALDEIVELCPGDLSAQRLRVPFLELDMRAAAANFFADAASYERDGLPDEAIRAARRGWTYADEATRARYHDLLDRLEHNSLSAEMRAQLKTAEGDVADGEVVAGYRLLQALLAKLPDHPLLRRRADEWHSYGVIAAFANATDAHPDDVVLQSQLAGVYLDRHVPAGAARVYHHLRELEPATLKWALEEADAWYEAGRTEKVAAVLRSMQGRWPAEAALAQSQYRISLTPPRLDAPEFRLEGNRAWSLVRTADPSGAPTLSAWLDDGAPQRAPSDSCLLELDLGRLIAGPHQVHVLSMDRYGNESRADLPATVPELDAGPCLRSGTPPPAPPAGARFALDPAWTGAWVVPAGTRLVLDGARLFPDQALAKLEILGQSVTQPPFRLELDTAGRRDTLALGAAATLADGSTAKMAPHAVRLSPTPPCWLVSPAPGSSVSGSVPVIVQIADRPTEAKVRVELDGWPVVEGSADEPLRLDTSGVASGEHSLRAIVSTADTSFVSPRAAVRFGEALAPSVADKPGQILGYTSAAGLMASAVAFDAAVSPSPAGGALRWETGGAGFTAGSPPAGVDTALRLDSGAFPPPRRLTIALGDSLGFGDAPPLAELGPGSRLVAGPLVTRVWTPPWPGAWRLTVHGLPLLVTVSESPGVLLSGPPPGARLDQVMSLRLWAAANIVRVTLLDGDRPLATCPTPAPLLDLDPARLRYGPHVLRAVGVTADGTRVVSPPLPIVSLAATRS